MPANTAYLLDASAASPGKIKDLAAKYGLSSIVLTGPMRLGSPAQKPPIPPVVAVDGCLPGVLVGDDSALTSAIDAVHEAGLDVLLAISDPFKGFPGWSEFFAKDNGGRSSSELNPEQPELCPNRPKLVKWLATAAADIVKTYKPAGLLLKDFHIGAADRIDPFFMCWCQTCRTRAIELGYDADRVGLALQGIRTKLTEGRPSRPALSRPGLGHLIEAIGYDTGIVDWLNFRADSISSCLFEIRKAVTAADPGTRVIVASHAPSVAIFFAQRRDDLLRDTTIADVAAPIVAGKTAGTLTTINLVAQVLGRLVADLDPAAARNAAAMILGHMENPTATSVAERETAFAFSAPTTVPQWAAIDTDGMSDADVSRAASAAASTEGVLYLGGAE